MGDTEVAASNVNMTQEQKIDKVFDMMQELGLRALNTFQGAAATDLENSWTWAEAGPRKGKTERVSSQIDYVMADQSSSIDGFPRLHDPLRAPCSHPFSGPRPAGKQN